MAASGVHREVAAAGRPEAGGRGGGGPGRVGLPARTASGRTGPGRGLACSSGSRPAGVRLAPDRRHLSFPVPPVGRSRAGVGGGRASGRPALRARLALRFKLVLAWTWDPAWPGRRKAERFGHCETESVGWRGSFFRGGGTDGRTDRHVKEPARTVFKQSANVEFYVSWARACPDFKFINTARSSQCCVRCW